MEKTEEKSIQVPNSREFNCIIKVKGSCDWLIAKFCVVVQVGHIENKTKTIG
jgi:hypothetical protein